MPPIADSVLDLIGQTPLVRAGRLAAGACGQILWKIESQNPGGSVKDRVGLALILDAEAKGLVGPGATLIEPTSGNTGVGLALAAAQRGYRLILTMPETMSIERRKLLAAYGAEIVLTPGAEGMAGAIKRADEIRAATPGAFMPQQFSNPANPAIHERTTGPEIWAATGGRVDCFIAGVGTGGTLSGVGRYLKAKNPALHIVGVEPVTSAVLSGGPAGAHGLQGIGAGFVPENYDASVVDEIIKVTDQDAKITARRLAREEGLLVGISSGAAAWAALQIANKSESAGQTIIALLPDTGERYLSTTLFDQD